MAASPYTAADLVPLAYSIPSVYANLTGFSYINGVFRVTFFEQHLSHVEGTAEMTEALSPRVSVTLTPATFAELARAAAELYNSVAASAKAAAEAEAFGPAGPGAAGGMMQ